MQGGAMKEKIEQVLSTNQVLCLTLKCHAQAKGAPPKLPPPTPSKTCNGLSSKGFVTVITLLV